jgi:hypothetical protein
MSNQFNTIIVSSPPRGVIEEVLISGTPKPGTCMTVLAATEPVAGKFTYEAYNRDADGDRAEVAVLLEDELQGLLVTTAYVAATQARVYFPAPGELLQMLMANIAGTGDAFAIGDYFIIDDSTGKLIDTTGSPEIESFVCMETQAAITSDTLVLCRFTGS